MSKATVRELWRPLARCSRCRPQCVSPQDTLMECVSKRVPILLSRGMARLVVVDSIAAPFRCEFHLQASAVRAKHLHSLGAALQRLSSTFRSPVLCINQVGAAGGEGEGCP